MKLDCWHNAEKGQARKQWPQPKTKTNHHSEYMNEENTNTEQQLLINAEAPAQPAYPFVCKKCGKGFGSMNAVRMHNMRVHSSAGQSGYKWKKMSKEQYLEHRRKKQQQLRASYYARGLDSRGRPTPAGYQPPRRRGTPWTPQRRAKFDSTWKKKRQNKPIRGNKQIRYVYPEPDSPLELLAEKITSNNARKINHCPYCGENILRHITSGGWQ